MVDGSSSVFDSPWEFGHGRNKLLHMYLTVGEMAFRSVVVYLPCAHVLQHSTHSTYWAQDNGA